MLDRYYVSFSLILIGRALFILPIKGGETKGIKYKRKKGDRSRLRCSFTSYFDFLKRIEVRFHF